MKWRQIIFNCFIILNTYRCYNFVVPHNIWYVMSWNIGAYKIELFKRQKGQFLSTRVKHPSVLPLIWEPSQTSGVGNLGHSVPTPFSGVWFHLVEIWEISAVRCRCYLYIKNCLVYCMTQTFAEIFYY